MASLGVGLDGGVEFQSDNSRLQTRPQGRTQWIEDFFRVKPEVRIRAATFFGAVAEDKSFYSQISTLTFLVFDLALYL